MKLMRTVLPEELDSLGPDDPSAIRSRRDLQRVHRAMATCSVLTRELGALLASARRRLRLCVCWNWGPATQA